MPYRIPGPSHAFAVGLLAIVVAPVGCADPCVDDGLVQDKQDCPAASASGTGTDSESASDTDSMTVSNSATMSVTASMSDSADSSSMTVATMTASDTDSMTASATDSITDTDSMTATESVTDTDTDTDGGPLWCVDADGDGFGDPDDCMNAPKQPPGTADNGDDCDDTDPDTFPGAAPNDDAEACMHDGDGDDWGDDNPGPGVDPGTDCDDDDLDTYPGAAENEPGLCGTDADGDGWGDANPGGGGDPGADCYDGNAELNPDTMALSMFVSIGFTGPAVGVPATDGTGTITTTALLDTPNQWNPVSATIDETGLIVVNNDSQQQLYSVDYSGVCDGSLPEGVTTAFPDQHGVGVFCGITFGPDGVLYGVRNDTDEISEFDLVTGQVASGVALDDGGVPIDVGSCGMSFDCHTQQVLLANGATGDVFSVDPANGMLTLLADTDLTWSPTGLAYEPVDRVVYIADDTNFYRVAIDGTNTVDVLGNFNDGVFPVSDSNLEVLPICQ